MAELTFNVKARFDEVIKARQDGSLLEGVGNILDTVTFGGLSSWLGDGSSDKNLEKDLARLSESNNNLKTSIDALADKMDEASSM